MNAFSLKWTFIIFQCFDGTLNTKIIALSESGSLKVFYNNSPIIYDYLRNYLRQQFQCNHWSEALVKHWWPYRLNSSVASLNRYMTGGPAEHYEISPVTTNETQRSESRPHSRGNSSCKTHLHYNTISLVYVDAKTSRALSNQVNLWLAISLHWAQLPPQIFSRL